MKLLFDFIPLILFFISYRLYDIFFATKVLIAVSILHYGYLWYKNKKLEQMHLITLIAILSFGSLTLFFHNETFLKLKAPIINGLFASFFLISQFISDQPLIQKMMGKAISLPKKTWNALNLSWVIFFLICGTSNLYVAFNHEHMWVDFKVFGSLGLTIVFIFLQTIFLLKHLKCDERV